MPFIPVLKLYYCWIVEWFSLLIFPNFSYDLLFSLTFFKHSFAVAFRAANFWQQLVVRFGPELGGDSRNGETVAKTSRLLENALIKVQKYLLKK